MKLLQFNKELKTSYITVLKHKILNKGGQVIKFLSICHTGTLIQSIIVKFDVVSFCFEL